MTLYSERLRRLGVPHAFVPAAAAGTLELRPPANEPRTRVAPQQVHGVRTVHARRLRGKPADGVWDNRRTTVIGVRTADCVPILLALDDTSRVAAIHAGWRGVAGGIVERFLHGQATRSGLAPDRWVSALGPAAGGDAYEVGPEVAAALGLPARQGPVDLRALLLRRLRNLGLTRVERVGPCTIAAGPPWASYRREGDAAGRNWAWIARPG